MDKSLDKNRSSRPTRRSKPEMPNSNTGINAFSISSRLPGFYELPLSERKNIIQRFANLSDKEASSVNNFGTLSAQLLDTFIENSTGTFGLPLGFATNFKINDKDVLVPMAVEETSVVAAASHGAKLARYGGGFKAKSSAPIMAGQIQLFMSEETDFETILVEHKQSLLDYANKSQEQLLALGGGAVDLTWRYIKEINSLVIHLHVNTVDAMGANMVNTMAEKVSSLMPSLFPCEIGLRILTNLADNRLSSAECFIPASAFNCQSFEGSEVVDRIVKAWEFANFDIYRATTNNKGIMNGIDPVLIATGNDWRAVEAGAHAYTCRSGQYKPMAKWSKTAAGHLHGKIEIPVAVGIVGGVTKLHPTAQSCLKLLGNPSGLELAQIVCSVGLAQNLSALRALASEGIQKGHMSLHKNNLDLLQRQGATKK